MPVMAPPRKATSSAGPMPRVAACAVRTLARTETFMPMKPQAPESTAPMTKPMAVVRVEEDADQDGQHHADDGDGLVLLGQVGRRAGLDGRRDLLHAGVARVLGKDPAAGPESISHGRKAADERQDQRRVACHSCFSYVVFAWRGANASGAPAALLPRSSPTGGDDWPTGEIYGETCDGFASCAGKARLAKVKSGLILGPPSHSHHSKESCPSTKSPPAKTFPTPST